MLKFILFTSIIISLYAQEPISPIPLESGVNRDKAKLGKELFFDTLLSKDNSVACVNCHDVSQGGADSNVVSIGFNGKKGNIQSPTVFNARYNFKQFWNGRAKNLYEQVDGPINNPVEHNLDSKIVEQRVNNSKLYKKRFSDIYGISKIKYTHIVDAIVEFEKGLITPNAKFDKYLRGEIDLSDNEKNGYKLFKQYGCITCHNGINIGSNSFQKMGTFIEYKSKNSYPDKESITNKQIHYNVFKVPTLRNINLTAPYFHDGSAKTLTEAIDAMAKHNLGVELSKKEKKNLIDFLNTLEGEKPAILESN